MAGRLLAGPFHDMSEALTGLTIFLTFGSGVVVQTTTTSWSLRRLVSFGICVTIVGLAVFASALWVMPPSLTLFIIGGVLIGGGGGAIFRSTLTVIVTVSMSAPDDRAGALATFFKVGCVGLSLPSPVWEWHSSMSAPRSPSWCLGRSLRQATWQPRPFC